MLSTQLTSTSITYRISVKETVKTMFNLDTSDLEAHVAALKPEQIVFLPKRTTEQEIHASILSIEEESASPTRRVVRIAIAPGSALDRIICQAIELSPVTQQP